jgi:hypothetical protein
MLAIAVCVLFTIAGVVAALTIADNLLKARAAYVRLMREGAWLQAGLALRAQASPLAAGPAPLGVTPIRRPAPIRARPLSLPRPACAAA